MVHSDYAVLRGLRNQADRGREAIVVDPVVCLIHLERKKLRGTADADGFDCARGPEEPDTMAAVGDFRHFRPEDDLRLPLPDSLADAVRSNLEDSACTFGQETRQQGECGEPEDERDECDYQDGSEVEAR